MATRRGLLDLPCITSTKNPRVKAARTAAKRGLVKLEGVRLVLDAISHGGVVPELVFIADDLFQAFSSASSASVSSSASSSSPDSSGLLHDALSPLLPRLGPDRIVRAAPHVIAAVSDTASPQGIVAFASGHRGLRPPPVPGRRHRRRPRSLEDEGNVGVNVHRLRRCVGPGESGDSDTQRRRRRG